MEAEFIWYCIVGAILEYPATLIYSCVTSIYFFCRTRHSNNSGQNLRGILESSGSVMTTDGWPRWPTGLQIGVQWIIFGSYIVRAKILPEVCLRFQTNFLQSFIRNTTRSKFRRDSTACSPQVCLHSTPMLLALLPPKACWQISANFARAFAHVFTQ